MIGTTLKNGAILVCDYADLNQRIVVAHWKTEYVCWVMDTDGNCFWGQYFPYQVGYGEAAALRQAVTAMQARIGNT